MNTLNDSAFLQLVFWHSADAVCGEVGVSRLQGGHQHLLVSSHQQVDYQDRGKKTINIMTFFSSEGLPGCSEDNKGFRNLASSTSQSGWHPRSFPTWRFQLCQCKIFTSWTSKKTFMQTSWNDQSRL